MPKIDVNEQLFFNLLGKKYDYSPEFEHLLSSAKAELDEAPSAATPQDERIIKYFQRLPSFCAKFYLKFRTFFQQTGKRSASFLPNRGILHILFQYYGDL